MRRFLGKGKTKFVFRYDRDVEVTVKKLRKPASDCLQNCSVGKFGTSGPQNIALATSRLAVSIM